MCYGIGEEPEKCPECKNGYVVVVITECKKIEKCTECSYEKDSKEIYEMSGI